MVQLTQGLLGISLPKDEFNNLKLFESFGVLFLKGIKVFLAQKANFLQNNRLLPKFYQKCFIMPNGFNSNFFLKVTFFLSMMLQKTTFQLNVVWRLKNLLDANFWLNFSRIEHLNELMNKIGCFFFSRVNRNLQSN